MNEGNLSYSHAIDGFDDRALAFVNVLSEPILLVSASGDIFSKNESFSRHLSNVSLNKLSFVDLSKYLKKALSPLSFPVEPGLAVYRTSLQYQEKQRHFITLYPFVFSNTHIVTIKSYDNEDLLQRVLDCIPARVFWKDVNSKFLGGNNLFLSDCGLSSTEQLIGLSDFDFFHKEEAESYVDDDKQVIRDGKMKLNIEEPQTHSNGEVSWLQTTKVPIRNNTRDIIGVMCSYTDITERKAHQQLIEKQARYDQLTKLYNRQALQEYLQQLERGKTHQNGCLLFIDLDNFKTVNDTLGHALGDSLLQEVSQRLKQCAKDIGFLVRLGGDEFGIVLLETRNGEGEALAETGNKLAAAIKNAILQPYAIESNHIQLGVSIGITYFYSDNIDWVNTFNEADMAMYDAKASGKNTVKVFTEKIRETRNYVYKMQTLINQAIESNEFHLKIQPQFDSSQTLIGAEALLRWRNKELGDVSPDEFIPICEQSGIIHDVGEWVFEEAFSLVSEWSKKYGYSDAIPLAVNLSAKQFQVHDFLPKIKKLLEKYCITPGSIHFELTESLLLESEADAIEKLEALKNMGFPLALDDFGTGYSCLSYLNQLPIKKIKIDKTFTFKVVEDERQAVLVQTIITMAKNLKMGVIAEGVETKEQLEFLRDHGCNEFQGYYFSKPISCAEYEDLLRAHLSKRAIQNLKKFNID